MEEQSGVSLTCVTMSPLTSEFENSGVRDHNATTNPPPIGSKLETSEQEAPSIIDIELEDVILPSNKGKEKAVS